MRCLKLWHRSCTCPEKSIWKHFFDHSLQMLCNNLGTFRIWTPYPRITKLYYFIHWPQANTFIVHTKARAKSQSFKFQLISIKFPNLHRVWTEGKKFSHPDLLKRCLATAPHDEHRLRTIEIPDYIKKFKTHNQQTQPIKYNYSVLKEYTNTLTTDRHYSRITKVSNIYLQMKDKYFKVQPENNL